MEKHFMVQGNVYKKKFAEKKDTLYTKIWLSG